MQLTDIVICSFVFVVVVLQIIGGIMCKRMECTQWNNGICAKSGREWVCFDVDSQGGRLYKDDIGNYCTISYDVDHVTQEKLV